MGIFKAYDIRGVYGRDWDGDTAWRIGTHLPDLLDAGTILVGHDARESSPDILRRLTDGIRDAGADVHCMGQASTPMVYFATADRKYPASVQITASHNPKEYNGLKISRAKAIPVGYDSGLAELERRVAGGDAVPASGKRGGYREISIRDDYLDFMAAHRGDLSALRIGVDCSNGMAGLVIEDVLGRGAGVRYINREIDGTFPNHAPNPLEEENVTELKALVSKNDLDVGVIFDGDADRVVFVDERARFIPPDLILTVLGRHFLAGEKGLVYHDIRTSWAVSEYLRELNGTPYMWKVGHAFAKVKLRELDGIFGGELAGHYYFRDFFYCDSGVLAALIVLNVVAELKREGSSLGAFIDERRRYASSGELNFRIDRKEEAMDALRREFLGHDRVRNLFDYDGYRLEFDDWWFNVRPSNTEPYLRLVTEARDRALLEEKLGRLRRVLARFQ